MNRSSTKAGILAALGAPVALTLTLGTMPAYAGENDDHSAESGARGNSAATITLEGCYLSSTKDISYIDYQGEGSAAGKDESVGTQYVDLTAVEGIETITSVEVKAGTTVETFTVDCAWDADHESGSDDQVDGDHDGEAGGDVDGETGGDHDGETDGDHESGSDDQVDDDHDGETGSDNEVDGESGSDVDGEAGGHVDGEADSDVDEEAGAGEETDGQAEGDGDADVVAGVDASKGAGSDAGAGAEAGADVDANAQGDAVLGVEREAAPVAPSTGTYTQAGAQQPTDMVLPQTGAEDNKLLALGGLGLVLAGAAMTLGRRKFGLGS